MAQTQSATQCHVDAQCPPPSKSWEQQQPLSNELSSERAEGSGPVEPVVEGTSSTVSRRKLSLKRRKERRAKSPPLSYYPLFGTDSDTNIMDLEGENDGFEYQILALEEQLVAAIIENQNLAHEIKSLRSSAGKEAELLLTLKGEKEKCARLEDKVRELEQEQNAQAEGTPCDTDSSEKDKAFIREKSPRSPSRNRFGWRRRGLEKSKSLDQSEFLSSLSPEGEQDSSSLLHLLVTLDGGEIKGQEQHGQAPEKLSFLKRLQRRFSEAFRTLMEDFSEVADDVTTHQENVGEQLTVKKLKESVIRFSAIMRPLNEFCSRVTALLRWESPATTFLAFSVYVGAILNGCAIIIFAALFIGVLSKNYLKKRGWPVRFMRSKSRECPDEGGEGEAKLGDKFAVVLQVARSVQNVLGSASDTAEKLKNLVLWEHKAATQLYVLLWILLGVSLLFTQSQIATAFALYFGFKIFVTDYIFFKFPRIRRKYDSTSRLWDTLPTDADLDKRAEKNGISPTDLNTFLELFNLPPLEVPLQGWHSGKRCTLINRDKSLTSAFRHGRLYLTNSYLCFERSKNNPEKNIKIGFCDVVSLEKANSYPWIPGGGMAIELLATSGKVFFFGGIINRDEVFDSILDGCRRSGHPPKKKEKDREKDKEQEKKDKEQEKKDKELEKNEKEVEKRKDCKSEDPSPKNSRRSSDPQDLFQNTECVGPEGKLNVFEFID